MVFALGPFEINRLHRGTASKSRAVRLAAHDAVAVQGVGEGAVDLVSHTAAQAGTFDHDERQALG
ncbi:hypothetical protein D3C77_747570 [compost metagenome]